MEFLESTGERHIISVSELNSQAKEILEVLNVWVEGEVTGMKPMEAQRYYYVYFSLQDTRGKAVMSCAMRRDAYVAMGLNLENGQNVIVQGKMSLLTQSGKAAFMVNNVEVSGQGKLAAELEKLKNKLQAEGLLADERKRPLPHLPQKIGVVTSVHSDAWVDFQRHSIEKFPVMQILVADSFVQGQQAPNSLVNAIKKMQTQDIEVLVVTRGGGSAEDLAAFNDERVVRVIAESKIPTIVGVGHEKDVSLSDLVADVRASTPTNAGQILTKGYEEVVQSLGHIDVRLLQLYHQIMERYYQRLDQATLGLSRISQKYQALPHQLLQISAKFEHHYHKLVQNNVVNLHMLQQKLQMSGAHFIQNQQQVVTSLERQLMAVSPTNVLSRGFSIVTVDDKIVRSVYQVTKGETMHIQLAKGKLKGLITNISENNDNFERNT